jgi:hypothetical protein
MAASSPRPAGRSNNNRNTLVGGIIALLVIIGAVLLVLWILDERREEGQGIINGGQPQTVSEVLANPAAFYGENIIVSGEVHQIVNPLAFVITDPIWAEGEAELLVIAPAPPAAAEGAIDETLYAEDVVQVTGVLHQYDAELIARELGATVEELQMQDLAEFEGRSVLIGEISGLTPRITTGDGSQASVNDIMSDPSDYYDERVIVSAEVTEVLSEQAFVLDGNLLVIDATGEVTQGAFEAASEIQVSGIVRQLDDPATVAGEYGVTLDATQVQQYQGGPVLVGEVITIMR